MKTCSKPAELDKKLFEDKFFASSEAFDGLQLQFTGLALKLDSTEENVRSCKFSVMYFFHDKFGICNNQRYFAFCSHACEKVLTVLLLFQ